MPLLSSTRRRPLPKRATCVGRMRAPQASSGWKPLLDQRLPMPAAQRREQRQRGACHAARTPSSAVHSDAQAPHKLCAPRLEPSAWAGCHDMSHTSLATASTDPTPPTKTLPRPASCFWAAHHARAVGQAQLDGRAGLAVVHAVPGLPAGRGGRRRRRRRRSCAAAA